MTEAEGTALLSFFGGWTLMACGQGLHLLAKFVELEDVDGPGAAWIWVKRHPFAILYSLLAGVVAYVLLVATNQMNVVAAVGCGYMADHIVNMILAKEKKRIEDRA